MVVPTNSPLQSGLANRAFFSTITVRTRVTIPAVTQSVELSVWIGNNQPWHQSPHCKGSSRVLSLLFFLSRLAFLRALFCIGQPGLPLPRHSITA